MAMVKDWEKEFEKLEPGVQMNIIEALKTLHEWEFFRVNHDVGWLPLFDHLAYIFEKTAEKNWEVIGDE